MTSQLGVYEKAVMMPSGSAPVDGFVALTKYYSVEGLARRATTLEGLLVTNPDPVLADLYEETCNLLAAAELAFDEEYQARLAALRASVADGTWVPDPPLTKARLRELLSLPEDDSPAE